MTKIHVPRKNKKQAKKLKSVGDASAMVQTALVTANNAARIAIISSQYQAPALKALYVAQTVIDTAQSIQKVMSQIKPWHEYVPNFYRS